MNAPLVGALLLVSGGLLLLVVGLRVLFPSRRPQFAERILRATEGVPAEPEMPRESLFKRVLVPLSERIGSSLRVFTPKRWFAGSGRLLERAGLRDYVTPVQLSGFCWLCLFVFLVVAVVVLEGLHPLLAGAGCVIAPLAGFRLPFFLLGLRASARRQQIVRSMPFALDLLSISVSAGQGFEGAMMLVAERTRGALAEELTLALTEIRLGKPRRQALLDLGERTEVEDLKKFVGAIVFVSDLGGSLSNVLRVQADTMRTVRKQRAEEKAMKAPIKMLFPLVFCIFPALGIVILVPAGLRIVEVFGQ